MAELYQDQKTGKIVTLLGIIDKVYAMVQDAQASVSYVSVSKLLPYDKEKGRLSEVPTLLQKEEEREGVVPENAALMEDHRLNLNTAPAEIIAKRLPGVGYATAKRIVELRMSLSGERFSNLKQLENIPRVNWDELIKDDLIFIG